MKKNKYNEMSQAELKKEISELKAELFKLRFQHATNKLESPMKIREVRKNIARANTFLKQKEIKEGVNVN